MDFDSTLNKINSVIASVKESGLKEQTSIFGNYPLISKHVAIAYLEKLSSFLKENSFNNELKDDNPLFTNFEQFLTDWNSSCVASNFGNHQTLSCLLFYALECAIFSFTHDLSVYLEDDSPEKIQKRLNKIKSNCKSFESQVSLIAGRFFDIDSRVASIEDAYEVSQKMPVSMEELNNNLKEIESIHSSVNELKINILDADKKISQIYEDVKLKQEQSSNLISSAEKALGMATNVSLASSFSNRKNELSTESIWWIVGLVVSLVATIGIGCWRIHDVMEFFQTDNFSYGVLFSNLILSFLICFAPFWGAWFSTRRLGYLFKLREDYAYKAATAIAFEGYRDQAAKYDENMEAQVIESVLKRFEEPPLRLMADPVRSSPISEYIAIFDYLKKNPSEREQLKEKIQDKEKNSSEEKNSK